MKRWIAFWNILAKDMRSYYLKPPNISWGLIFPLAWTGMFFIKSGAGMDERPGLCCRAWWLCRCSSAPPPCSR